MSKKSHSKPNFYRKVVFKRIQEWKEPRPGWGRFNVNQRYVLQSFLLECGHIMKTNTSRTFVKMVCYDCMEAAGFE